MAAMGVDFHCADLGLRPGVREDHAAYVEHWPKVLKEVGRAIFQAAAHAQNAADYLNDLQPAPADA